MSVPKIMECSITGAGVDRLAKALRLALDPWGDDDRITPVAGFIDYRPGSATQAQEPGAKVNAHLVIGGSAAEEKGGVEHTLPGKIDDVDLVAALVQVWLDDLQDWSYGPRPRGDGSTQRGWRVESKWHKVTVHATWLYIGK